MMKMGNIQKEVQAKLAKGLLDLIVLQFLNGQPTHGYQIITKIRKCFGVYFGPSTIAPLLARSEEHTSELQSHLNLVCRLLLEKKKKHIKSMIISSLNKLHLRH